MSDGGGKFVKKFKVGYRELWEGTILDRMVRKGL